MTKSKVVVLGDACVDMVIRLPDRKSKRPDLKNSVPQLQGGGSAANVAVVLARLGVEVTMVGAVGDDGYGRWIHDDLGREGVDILGICSVHDAFTPMVLALIELNGERSIVVWPPEGGAHLQLQTDAINPELIKSASWLHTTGICLRESPSRDTVLYSMKMAREAGVTVSLDLNLRLESWDLSDVTQKTFEQAIELSDIVFGNAEEEIMPITGADSKEKGAQYLCGGKRIIVARRGKKGVFVTTPNETIHVSPFKTRIVNTLGAGDAFNGGFIAASLAKVGIKEAARWGNAVAALKVGQSGARDLPIMEDVKKMLG
jgi:sugar/nucleoside kinase (ribokinase family)